MRLTTCYRLQPETFEKLKVFDKEAYFLKVDNDAIEAQKNAFNKLGQLEDIEEEKGIDLIVREQALEDGFYYIDEQNNIVHVSNYLSNRSYGFVCAEYDTISYYEVCLGELRKECQFYYTDYGKKERGGWALTKEELEK